MFTQYLLIQGCYNPGYHGDGACDDENNNEACFFDGGDCCGSNVNINYCTICQCLELEGGGSGGTTTPSGTSTSGSCNPGWSGDNYCDDSNNNLNCNFDGGDCCGPNVNTLWCTECLCLEEGGGASGGTTPPPGTTTLSETTTSGGCNPGWSGDNYCDDFNNNINCNFDGGDCCGPNVNTLYCDECECLEGGSGGTTTPSGTTTSGSCNLAFIGDNYCDDINNTPDCNFDGGDCCGSDVNTSWCIECQCLEEGGDG